MPKLASHFWSLPQMEHWPALIPCASRSLSIHPATCTTARSPSILQMLGHDLIYRDGQDSGKPHSGRPDWTSDPTWRGDDHFLVRFTCTSPHSRPSARMIKCEGDSRDTSSLYSQVQPARHQSDCAEIRGSCSTVLATGACRPHQWNALSNSDHGVSIGQRHHHCAHLRTQHRLGPQCHRSGRMHDRIPAPAHHSIQSSHRTWRSGGQTAPMAGATRTDGDERVRLSPA